MFPSHFLFYVVIIVACITISQIFTVQDKYSDYNTVVLNQIVGIILKTKRFLYDFKEFYSSGAIDFEKYNLINHYLTLADIECLMNDNNTLDACSSYHVNDVSVPTNITNPSLEKYTCVNREYGDNNEQCKVRILNYDYVFNRTCINLVFTEIQKIGGGRFVVTIKNDMSAYLLMLLRPVYVTTSMSYLYKVIYEKNQIHYNVRANCPRKYTSTGDAVKLIIEKVEENQMYANKSLIDIDKIKDFEIKSAKADCTKIQGLVVYDESDIISVGNDAFPCALTVYYLSLSGKAPGIPVDLTNSMTVYFDIDISNMKDLTKMFELRRSSEGTQHVCKTIAVELVNNGSEPHLNIILNEMSSMTHTFYLPTERKAFKIFVTYSLDMIQVYSFYDRTEDSKAFQYELFNTSLVSSWSIKDVNAAVALYNCAVPMTSMHANSVNIPSYYHLATAMKLI